MRRSLRVIISIISALTGLTLALASLALASNNTPANSPPSLPPARPPSPSSGVYSLYDSLTPADLPTATFNFINIRTSANVVWDLGGNFIDDDNLSPPFPIGFYFPFYDDFYTEFRVSEDGYILFEKAGVNVGGNGLPAQIPSNNLGSGDGANNFIAPFAGDLFGYPGISRVYVRNDSSPRRTIIEFENVVWCCGQNNPRTFEVILYPSGAIEKHYLKLTNFPGPLDAGQNIQVGLENLTGSAGDVYEQGLFDPDDANFWQDGLALRYEPNFSSTAIALFLPGRQAIWDDPGQPITLTPDLYLIATENVTRSFNLTYALAVSSAVSSATWASNITYPTFIPAITGTFSGTVQVVLTVPVGANINDLAVATFTAQSVQPPLMTATFVVTYGPAHRDLQIAKALDPTIAPALDGAFRYRLTVTNTDFNNSNRAAIARGVVVTDVLPLGIAYEDCRRPPNDQPCGASVVTGALGAQTVVTWNVGTMNVDEEETRWLELRNNNSLGALVTNTARVTTTASFELGYPFRNSDNETFTVASAESDLFIDKDYPYGPFNNENFAAAGQAIPYDLYFYNSGRQGDTGNVPISNVTLVDILPANTTFNRATLGFNYSDSQILPLISGPMSRTLTFNGLAVDNGFWNREHIRLWVNVPQTTPLGTRLTNTVTVSDGLSQDSDREVIVIASNQVDPFVDKEPSRDQAGNLIAPEPGQDYTYWITYGNRSVLTDAFNVTIVDTLPPSVTLVSASPGRYLTGPFTSTLPGGIVQITWYTDTAPGIPRGGVGQVAIIVHVDDDVPRGTLLINQMTISYTGSFTPATDLDDTDIVTVEVASDINGSRKLVDRPTANAGDMVTYTIVVSNIGSTNAPFTVTDAFPPELTFAGSDPPSTGAVVTGANQLTWTGNVGAGAEASLTFRAIVTETAQLSDVVRNTANIDSPVANISRSVDVTVVGGVFGSSRKIANLNYVRSGGIVTYTIRAINSGSAGGVVTVTDSLPVSTTLISGSFSPNAEASNVTLSGDNRAFTWTTSVAALSQKNLRFRVTVADGLTNDITITNVAYLADGSGLAAIPLTATFTISNAAGPGDIYLPLIVK